MTSMTRKSISLTPELEKAIFELRKTERFCRCSVSEIMRILLIRGLEAEEHETQSDNATA